MKNNFFSIGFTPHRLWGNIFIPYILIKDSNDEFHSVGEVVIKDENTKSYQRLTPMQRKIVDIIDEYSDKNLHKVFSKKKTVKEFQDHVDKEITDKFIRPYIEKRLYEVMETAGSYRIPIFLKLNISQNIFEDDFLIIHKEMVKPFFHFHRTPEGTQYHLSVIHKDKKMNFREHHAELISNIPAAVLLDNEIFFVEEIEGKKLLPFFTKEEIIVPAASEEKYYRSFVTNTLKSYDFVENDGFRVEDIVPEKRAILTIESGLRGEPGLVLNFQYNQYAIFPASHQKRFVDLKIKDREYIFSRFDRDFSWEKQFAEALDEIGLKSHDGNNYTLSNKLDGSVEDKECEFITFINDQSQYLVDSGFILHQKLEKNYYLGQVELEVSSSEQEDWFDLHMIINTGKEEIPFILLRDHILNNQRTFELSDGSFFVIPSEWFAKYRPIFEFGKIVETHIQVHKQHFSQVDAALRKKHASTIKDLEKLTTIEKLPEIPVPAELQAELRNYQKEGYAWMWFLKENGFGGCLADDMGLGKTIQTLALLEHNRIMYNGNTAEDPEPEGQLSLFSENVIAPTSLVVVPATLVQNWINEFQRFLPSYKILLHTGVGRSRNTHKFSDYDIVISSYHTVRQDIEFISDFTFQYVILDESQMIKNPHSKLYKAMLELSAMNKLVLTGTPIENSLTDLWAQINFVNEGLLGSLSFFKKKFVYHIERKKDQAQEDRLKALISPFILRRTKEEVAKELPLVYEQYRYCSMTEEQKTLYEEEKSTVRNMLLDNFEEIGMNGSAMMVLKALTRLRQISNHPAMVEDEYEHGSGKYDEVFRNVESVVSEGHKVLIFSSFVKHLDIYAKQFDAMGWQYAKLTGSTTDRNEQVEKFQTDPECRIFLISLKAGGVGLNLTAADYVFILDPWWNPAAEMQALSRAHRIGQDKNVFVYRFISNQTVEEKIVRLQKRKSELAKTFVTSNNPLRNMKKKEVMELFA